MPSFSKFAILLASVQPMLAAPTLGVSREKILGGLDDWQNTLSRDTHYRLELAREHLDDRSTSGQAFRNDTIMRINIEREALELSLIDLSQAFGMTLPTSPGVAGTTTTKRSNNADGSALDPGLSGTEGREDVYTRSGGMTYKRSNNADGGALDPGLSGTEGREDVYTRSGGMTYKRSNNADGGALNPGLSGTEGREDVYTRSGGMTAKKRSNNVYSGLLNRDNLALGAIERINIARRVLNKPELTMEQAKEMGSHGDEFISGYWNSSMSHGGIWTTDQAEGKPNFIEGGQANGFGFTQSTFHKRHCLANLRTILAWHITGNSEKMTRDMNMHTIHCLEYMHSRELANPDQNKEPIDTVDYEGMGIH